MNIRKANGKDVHDLKTLYFDYLTKYPPNEEQDMKKWEKILNRFEEDDTLISKWSGNDNLTKLFACIKFSRNIEPALEGRHMNGHHLYFRTQKVQLQGLCCHYLEQ